VGIDLVAMGVNDLLVHGAEPLYFLDYIGIGKIDPARVEALVRGVADGCRLAGCSLIGGETAELPDLYAPGEYDLAGFAVGIVERERILDGAAVKPGDVVLGLASSGLHSNGYSLARRIVFDVLRLGVDSPLPGTRCCWSRRASTPRPSAPSWARFPCPRWRTSPAAASRATCRACCPRAAASCCGAPPGASPRSSPRCARRAA
jgi:hypothetical protein